MSRVYLVWHVEVDGSHVLQVYAERMGAEAYMATLPVEEVLPAEERYDLPEVRIPQYYRIEEWEVMGG